jgi:hypothetical protein
LEKWWALQTVNFAQLEVGPMWTPAASRANLAAILSVPVDYRSASNSLPMHAEISLQDAIRNFNAAQKNSMLQTKLRDLRIAELRMSPDFALLAAKYVKAISDYLDQRPVSRRIALGRNAGLFAPSQSDMKKTLETLDFLDARRRNVETTLDRAREFPKMPALTERNSNL